MKAMAYLTVTGYGWVSDIHKNRYPNQLTIEFPPFAAPPRGELLMLNLTANATQLKPIEKAWRGLSPTQALWLNFTAEYGHAGDHFPLSDDNHSATFFTMTARLCQVNQIFVHSVTEAA